MTSFAVLQLWLLHICIFTLFLPIFLSFSLFFLISLQTLLVLLIFILYHALALQICFFQILWKYKTLQVSRIFGYSILSIYISIVLHVYYIHSNSLLLWGHFPVHLIFDYNFLENFPQKIFFVTSVLPDFLLSSNVLVCVIGNDILAEHKSLALQYISRILYYGLSFLSFQNCRLKHGYQSIILLSKIFFFNLEAYMIYLFSLGTQWFY